jgi:hypothetical protein
MGFYLKVPGPRVPNAYESKPRYYKKYPSSFRTDNCFELPGNHYKWVFISRPGFSEKHPYRVPFLFDLNFSIVTGLPTD